MPGIQLATTFTDLSLPTGVSLAQQLLDNANLTHWYQADPEHVDLVSDKVSLWTNRAGTGDLVQSDAARRATLPAAAIGVYSAASFTDAIYQPDTNVPDMSAAFTWAVVYKAGAWSANRTLCGSFADPAQASVIFQPAANQMRFKWGNAAITSTNSVDSAWNVVFGSYDGTDIHMRINGITETPQTVSGSEGPSTFAVGAWGLGASRAYWDGNIADVIVWDYDLLASGNSAELAKVVGYFDAAYGLTA